jgi:hypothetical protein
MWSPRHPVGAQPINPAAMRHLESRKPVAAAASRGGGGKSTLATDARILDKESVRDAAGLSIYTIRN